MGYTAQVEQSLQIRRHREPLALPKSDVLLLDTDPMRAFKTQIPALGRHAALIPLAELLDLNDADIREYKAIALYEIVNPRPERGEPVVWIELLSPSNKAQDAEIYRQKRLKLLQAGIVFVEIDYLHETPPTFTTIPDYTQNAPSSSPYRIIVIDPRPVFWDGKSYVHPFAVDEAIPTVVIPLNGQDVLQFDFAPPYDRTLRDLLYTLELVDYRELPMHFERYSASDQAHIAQRMVAVLEAKRDGLDLETGIFPTREIPLDVALATLRDMR